MAHQPRVILAHLYEWLVTLRLLAQVNDLGLLKHKIWSGQAVRLGEKSSTPCAWCMPECHIAKGGLWSRHLRTAKGW